MTVPASAFRITALPRAPFEPLFALSDAALADRHIIRVTVTEPSSAPCRISLQDAAVGETVLLLNHEYQPAETPYRGTHAIYVREVAEQAHPDPGDIPDAIRRRLLSVRAFDAAGMMVDAEVAEGRDLAPLAERFFAQPSVAYLHLHHARRGCYAARVDRAG